MNDVEIVGLQVWEIHAERGAQLEDAGEEQKWSACEEYRQANERASLRDIAERVGKHHSHIGFMIQALSSKLDNPDLSFTQAYNLHANAKGAHVSANAGDNEWYTPADYIAAAVDVMGGIDLDPASTPEANTVVGAAKIYTAQDDGLAHGWGGRVWMNPPYARPLIDSFCGKLAEEYAAGNVHQAITLTNNATETGWFHALAEVGAAMCFPRHRVRFWHPEKESAPLQGQALVYFGDESDAFRREFVRFGFTAVL